jgi:ectoine hydroxylase-related dioxygenase (phytanoyl-CoA dioxygenase family)
MECKYGECIQWDGSNLTHGNEKNVTGKTRVSVDSRVITESNYIPNESGSINTNTPFALGGYYKM